MDERLAQLEARLEHLENLEAIRRILGSYCKALDDRDIAQMKPLWSRDAVLLTRPWPFEFHGAEAIINFYSEYFKGPTREPRHVYSNEVIRREGKSYVSHCYFNETLVRGEHSVVGWGTYNDCFCQEEGIWKFGRREITILALTPIARGWAIQNKIMDLME